MTDPKFVKKGRAIAQEQVKVMVSRIMSDRMKERTILNEVEHKLVKAVYNPDFRMR